MTYLSLNITPSMQAPNSTIQERSVTETEGRIFSKNHIEEIPPFFTKIRNEDVHDNVCMCVYFLVAFLFVFF